MQLWQRPIARTAQPTDPTGVNPDLPAPLFALNAALGNHEGFYDAVHDRFEPFLDANTTRINCGAGVGFFPNNNALDTNLSRKSIDIDFTPLSTHVLIWIDSYGSVASGTTNGWYYEPYESGTQRIRIFINSAGLSVQVFGTNIEGLAGSKLGLNSVFVRGEDSTIGYDIWVNGVRTNIRGPAAGSYSPTVREAFIRQAGANGASAYILQAASWDADHFDTIGQALSLDPWMLWEPERIWVPVSASGGAPTGTLSATETGADTAAISGAVAISGSLSSSEAGSDTSAIQGAVAVAGSLAASEAGDDTVSVSGQVAVTGALAVTETGDDTVAVTGTVTVTGSLAAAETGADTAAVAGAVAVAGDLAATEAGADTAAVAGLVAVTGDLAATETGADTFAATGGAGVQGSLAATETGADTAAVSGTVAVAGALAATEVGSDSVAVVGAVVVTGDLAATESGADVASIIGGNVLTGSLAATETGADTAAVAGLVAVTGSLAATETGVDTAAAAGAVAVTGALAATETGTDTAAIVGGAAISGAMAASEAGSDSCAATGQVLVDGLLAAVEGGTDTTAVAGQIIVTGLLGAVETGHDTAFITSSSLRTGTLAAQETGTDSMATNFPNSLGYRRVVFSADGRPTILDPLDIEEVDYLGFDYRRELIGDEALTYVYPVEVTVVSGDDAQPEALLLGNAIIQDGYFLQQVKGHTVEDTVVYHLRGKVTTDNGRTLVSSGDLPVKRL